MAEPLRRLFTRDEYYAMAEAGILKPEDRVELIEGEIYRMAPIGNAHAKCVNRLVDSFAPLIAARRAALSPQNPVALTDLSEPEPDVVLLRRDAGLYAESHPAPREVLLLIEVADSSAGFDRGTKIPLYALCGIPEAWLVDLAAEVLGSTSGLPRARPRRLPQPPAAPSGRPGRAVGVPGLRDPRRGGPPLSALPRGWYNSARPGDSRMPKNSFADDTVDWSQLLLSVGKRDREVPFLKDLLSELQLILNTVTGLDTERLQLKARSQQISRDLDALRNRGRNVAGRVRSGIRTQYGYDSELLTEFGLNPRRRKVRTRLAEQEALAKISDPDPVS